MNKSKIILISLLLPLYFIISCNNKKLNNLTITINDPLPVTSYDSSHDLEKSSILDYLETVRDANPQILLVGQNMGHADWEGSYLFSSYMEDCSTETGKQPAIMAIDLGWNDFSGDYSQLISDIQSFWNNNGLVTLSFHMPNPKTLSDVRDKNFTSEDYDAILMDGTSIKNNWRGMLSNIANVFQELKNRDIIVLFRPLHEMNGGWFWWGNSNYPPTDAQFMALWQDLHSYMTVERQLDNLLWVYSPNYKYTSLQPATDYFYPGDSFVDIVGLDFYHDDINELNAFESYDNLTALGKPLAICEMGPGQTRDGSFDLSSRLAILSAYPEVSYLVEWHSFPENNIALHHLSNSSLFMNAEGIITLDEITR